MGVELTPLSRLVSRVLRHEPWLYELELDDEGWTSTQALLEALRSARPAWRNLREEDLVRMIDSSSKRRHEIADGRIRAIYGHSLPGKILRRAAPPPAVLFHGTSGDAARRIQQAGLRPMRRQYVHLSVDVETALQVGRRKTASPVLLQVNAHEANSHDVTFYEGNDKVWLADVVPPEFIVHLAQPGSRCSGDRLES